MGKITQENKKHAKQPNKTTRNTTKHHPRPEAESPSNKQCFLCTKVRQVRKIDCIQSKGLNSLRSLSKGSVRERKSRLSLPERLRANIKTVTTRPLHRAAKHGHIAFRSGLHMTVSRFLPKEISCRNARLAKEKCLFAAQPIQLIAQTK